MSEHLVDTIEYKGYEIEIFYDEYAESPREWDNLGTMICFHGRYSLGDKHNYTPDTFLQELAIKHDNKLIDRIEYWNDGKGWSYLSHKYENELGKFYSKAVEASDTIIKKLIDESIDKHLIILPLYLYDHSGITMRTYPFSCPWDSGQVGFIYVSKNEVKKEWGWKKLTRNRIKKIEDLLKSEVEVYDQYLRGSVYWYNIEDSITGKHIDSCGGFYGYNWEENGILEYAKPAIDYYIESK